MRKTGFPLVLFGLLFVLSMPTTSAFAQATRTWVSGVGDDANPCSRTAPCKTFAGSISKTAAGGEIDCLDPGGFGTLTITKAITIDCGPMAGGVLNSGTNGIVVNAGVNDKVVLRNLVIQGTTAAGLQGTNGIRWLAGLELHLDRVVVQGQSVLGVDVAKAAFGTLYVRNSYFTEVPTAINLSTTSSFVIASIDSSYFHGMSANGVVAASANAIANVSNSVFENNSGIALSASASGAFLNANNNVLSNNGTGISAVSGANLRLSNNDLYDNTTGISATGASFLSAGNNRVSGGTTTGTTSSGAIPLR
jgi:hypothetical protein